MHPTTRIIGVLGLVLAALAWLYILTTYDAKLDEQTKEYPLEKAPEKVSQGVDGAIKEKHGGMKGAIRPPKRVNASAGLYLVRNRTASARLAAVQLYTPAENVFTEVRCRPMDTHFR